MPGKAGQTSDDADIPHPSKVGKRVRGAVYVHASAVHLLEPPLLRDHDEALRAFGGKEPPTHDVVRIEAARRCVAWLEYPSFFDEPFPTLRTSHLVDLDAGELRTRRYDGSGNPPVLHRKELLLPPGHPRAKEYAALTASLERAGVFSGNGRIGFLKEWEARLEDAGVVLDGHRVIDAGTQSRRGEDRPLRVERHRTAMTRYALSAPFQALGRHGYLDGGRSVFDYGCGRGGDLDILAKNGLDADGWDPHYRPDTALREADIVNIGFVINVIEDRAERQLALTNAFALCRRVLSVAAMLGGAGQNTRPRLEDGVLSARNTFQKYFSQHELGDYISEVLGELPIAAGPGVFFVFKDKLEEQRFLEERQRNRRGLERLISRIPKPTRREREQAFYETHRSILDGLTDTWLALGRKPRREEIRDTATVLERFGSVSKALGFLRRFHGDAPFRAAADARRDDLRVYFALLAFERRGAYRTFPDKLRADIRVFFGSYKNARTEALALLYSAGEPEGVREACEHGAASGLGRLDDEGALHLHTSAVAELPPVLRVYVGCASRLYGDVTSANLLKVHPGSGKLSLMSFDDFEGGPLPRMTERVKVRLREQRVQLYEYGPQYEPPFLYMKSRYIPEDFPHYDAQLAFDRALDGLRLFDFTGHGPSPAQLEEGLAAARMTVDSFSLRSVQTVPGLDERCGKYLTFRDLIHCGETQSETGLENQPSEIATYNALTELVIKVLDPVMDYFGGIRLTFGFCSRELARRIAGRIAPALDQHAACELNARGKPICPRRGAAVDFLVPDESMLEVARWIVANTPFDRLYYYGDCKPVHVSAGPEANGAIVVMTETDSGRRVPRVTPRERFMEITGVDKT